MGYKAISVLVYIGRKRIAQIDTFFNFKKHPEYIKCFPNIKLFKSNALSFLKIINSLHQTKRHEYPFYTIEIEQYKWLSYFIQDLVSIDEEGLPLEDVGKLIVLITNRETVDIKATVVSQKDNFLHIYVPIHEQYMQLIVDLEEYEMYKTYSGNDFILPIGSLISISNYTLKVNNHKNSDKLSTIFSEPNSITIC